MITAKQILKKINCKHLNLYQGDGYWYFIYDNGSDKYESRSVMCMRLNWMDIENWIYEGAQLVKEMENK